MFDKIITLTEAIVGFIGVLVGAFITWRTTLLAEKKRNAVAHYSDFSSVDMESAREIAFNYLRENLKSTKPLTFQQMHEQIEGSKLIAVSRIVHFWEKTWHLIEHGYVDKKLTKILLHHYFKNHYQTCLSGFARICETEDNTNYQRWIEAIRSLAKNWEIH